MQNNGNLHVNFSLIARELGISVMTIYRVINNAPHVSEKMRAAVISRLNSYGFFSRSSLAHRRILFDFSDHPYLFWLGKKLQKLFPNTTESDHRKNSEEFFNAAASADTIVFCSNPSDAVIRKIKAENPELYTITLTTESCADVTITPDNKLGGELAARHLYYHGHRHIAVHLAEEHPTRMERYKSFRGELAVLDPDCRIDEIPQKEGDSFHRVIEAYFHAGNQPTAICFLTGGFGQDFWEEFRVPGEAFCRDLSIMSYDRPDSIIPRRKEIHPLDRIEFDPQNILDWAEYYILHPPMMRDRSPIHTCVRTRLQISGSVRTV